ncbi:MAG: hypothetical protein OEZ22_13555 [Spirochaetia bacterium]|nr:hypothetical protein [Spirochaetia bacterium]
MKTHEKFKRQLIILSILEEHAMSTKNLRHKLNDQNILTSTKTLQRDLNEHIPAYDFKLIFKLNEYELDINDNYHKAFANFFHRLFEEIFFMYTYGDITSKAVKNSLSHLKKPAGFIKKILLAFECSQEINFFYAPQHEETIKKIANKRFLFSIETPKNTIPVKMLPRFFAFAPDKVLLSGESYFIHSDKPLFRHYDLKGITEIEQGEIKQSLIKENPETLYKNSFHIWQGGHVYKLKIEEKNLIKPDEPKVFSLTVNGEEEILSYVASSLGRLKIINPPQEIQKKAQEAGLTADTVFRF